MEEAKRQKKEFLFRNKNYRFLDRHSYTRYSEYKKKSNLKNEDSVDLAGYKKIGSEIFKEIGVQLVKREGGVLIKNFGYFFNARFAYSGVLHLKNGGHVFQPKFKNKVFKPIFLPDGSNIENTFWSMDKKFSRVIERQVTQEVKSGKRYKAFFYSLRPLLGMNLRSKNTYFEKLEVKQENV